MPQEDGGATQLKHAEEVFGVELPTSDQAPVVMQPSKESLDLPAVAVAAQRTPVLRRRTSARRVVRCNEFDPIALAQPLVQPVAVVGAVSDHPFGDFGEEPVIERGFDQLRFMRRSAGDAAGERKTMAVDERHDFGAFPAASRADSSAPFFALEKLASMNVSDKSSFPRSRRSSASACSNRVSVPSRCHCWKRRWQV